MQGPLQMLLIIVILAPAVSARDLPNPADGAAQLPRGRELLGQSPTAWDMDECARAGALRDLADCGWGFGKEAGGGRSGSIYQVTHLGDSTEYPQPGTLRHALTRPYSVWVTFNPGHMVINLKAYLDVPSGTTIDGRGARVEIVGRGLYLQNKSNVIVTHVSIHNCLTDCISLRRSRDIWINHVDLYRGGDGLIDITKTSTRVTVSHCHLHDHHKAMLLGASNENVEASDSARERSLDLQSVSEGVRTCCRGFRKVLADG
ncbi:Pectin lyase-like superfamily protein [Klebsormidium nitens]|uniref:Pectate lyase n=1 Tax=Klebsormidium nitens TaxID=105231 RepID=A0A1Y1HMG5_KLENI|nr:Pectin lyase-like superfamily protein [Klebsormidium nitens]|eukprot:GAQ78389.1 Pectin lyase-like superfamily protein [Klebsormidium nitens]